MRERGCLDGHRSAVDVDSDTGTFPEPVLVGERLGHRENQPAADLAQGLTHGSLLSAPNRVPNVRGRCTGASSALWVSYPLQNHQSFNRFFRGAGPKPLGNGIRRQLIIRVSDTFKISGFQIFIQYLQNSYNANS
jgi:hypothetical protein